MTRTIFLLSTTFVNLITLTFGWSLLFIILSKFIKKLNLLLIVSFASMTIPLYFITIGFGNVFFESSLLLTISVIVIDILIFLLILKLSLFNPLPGAVSEKVLPNNTKYLDLSSGSKIAYWYYKAAKKRSNTPIIYIHGGPGAHTRNIDREFLSSFTKEGYDVLCYDQPGGGFSDYLDINDYTMDRFVEDLERIRIHFEFDKIILLGQSFGARISSYYASKYEENVESIIFAGPAGLKSTSIKSDLKSEKELSESKIEFATSEETKFKPTFKEAIRFAFTILTAKFGGYVIAEQMTSQKEITEYSTRMIPDAIGRAYHKKYQDLVPKITSGGINVLVNVVLHNNYDKVSIDMIDRLSNSSVPVLILRSAYDYVPWEDQVFFKKVFKKHYLVYIPESGHIAWSVNKEATYSSILNFVKKNYNALHCYYGEDNPLTER